jgi:hypothetical protein
MEKAPKNARRFPRWLAWAVRWRCPRLADPSIRVLPFRAHAHPRLRDPRSSRLSVQCFGRAGTRGPREPARGKASRAKSEVELRHGRRRKSSLSRSLYL